jgi:hypothetical protein
MHAVAFFILFLALDYSEAGKAGELDLYSDTRPKTTLQHFSSFSAQN